MLDRLVDALSGPIRLRVECRRQISTYVELSEDFVPPAGGKGGAAVGGDVVWESVASPDVFYEERAKRGSSIRFMARNEVAHLCEPIYNNENGIKRGGRGKVGDVVPRDRAPRARGDWERLKETAVLVMDWLDMLALVTGRDVIVDKGGHARPGVIARD